MAGMPLRRLREINKPSSPAGIVVPADKLARQIPADWGVMSESMRLQAMWGCSLTVGMETLCWGPLRSLTPAELTFLDRVRHDTMLICARFGLAQLQRADLASEREFRDAIKEFDLKMADAADRAEGATSGHIDQGDGGG